MDTGIQVVQLVSEWEFSITKSGARGTRKYIDAAMAPDATAVTLPDIGDSWDENYPNCVCVEITVNYLNDNDRCGKIYTCRYSSDENDELRARRAGEYQPADEKTLAQSIDMSADIMTIEPYIPTPLPDSLEQHWRALYRWESDQEKCRAPLGLIVPKTTLRIERILSDEKLVEFLKASQERVGKVNEKTFLGFEKYTWLYLGASMRSYYTAFGLSTRKRWRADLTFVLRTVHEKGWQAVWRDGVARWDVPRVIGVTEENKGYLYETASFDELLTVGGPDVEPIQIKEVSK